MYKKLNDYNLLGQVNKIIVNDPLFKNPYFGLDLTVFNGDILIVGHLPSEELLSELQRRLNKITGYRRLFNKITISQAPINNTLDMWITAKIRSQIIADDTIDPNAFKIITSDSIVYLMGDVKPEQAKKVVEIARFTSGVQQVIKMLMYYTYQVKNSVA